MSPIDDSGRIEVEPTPHLYRALSEEGRPELSTVFKVMQALGLRLAPVRVDFAA